MSARRLPLVLLGLACVALATEARADDPVIERYPPSSVRPKLIAGGLAVTGAAYGVGYLCVSQWPDVPGSDALKVPVVGPFIALAQNECAPDSPDCGFTLYFRGFLEIVSGLMQLGGLGLVGEGVFMTTESGSAKERPAAAGVTIRPVPVVTAHTSGIGVVGSF